MKQQKESDYLKKKPFSKSSNYFWNTCEELLEKKLSIHSSLLEVFLRNNVSESFFIWPANLLKGGSGIVVSL